MPKLSWKVIWRLEIFNHMKDYKGLRLEDYIEITGDSIINTINSFNLDFDINSLQIKELIKEKAEEVFREKKLISDLYDSIKKRPAFKEDIIDFLYRDAVRKVLVEKYNHG
nr:hypothetical protein [uncultured archaeon]